MFGNDKSSDESTIALSQDELDKILKQGIVVKPASKPSEKKASKKSTEEKIKLLKARTKAVGKKIQAEDKKKSTSSKTLKKAPTSKKTKKKTVEKLSIYYNDKFYGYGTISKRNGKKIIELLSVKK